MGDDTQTMPLQWEYICPSTFQLLDAGAEPVKAVAAAAAPAKEAEIDLWGDEEEGGESYEESVARKKKGAEEKKAKKKAAPIAKSSILYSIKPACFDGDDDDEDGGGVADLDEMEAFVRSITMEGLTWGASKKVAIGYGISKLTIMAVVEDDEVSTDDLQETIEENEDPVQSIEIDAFNKI